MDAAAPIRELVKKLPIEFWRSRNTEPNRFHARLTQKLRDSINHGLLLVFTEFGEDGQRQHFAGSALGFRKAAFDIAKRFQGLLQVERDGVVDFRADLASGEEFAKLVAAGGADDVLMPDVLAAWDLVGKNDTVDRVWTRLGQSRCVE